MQIKHLIEQLQTLYNTYNDEYKATMGEPEIVIDMFEKRDDTGWFEYAGFSPWIVIEKTDCGTYDILNAFYDQDQEPETKKPLHTSWPFPPSR
jgi:hypothetical protein